MRRGVPLLLAAGLACAHLPGAPRAIPECPGPLRATSELGPDRHVELHMRVQADDVDSVLRLALEIRDDELVLVGIDPLGAVLFELRQRGVEVEAEALPAALLPVPPENVLRDVHRVRFLAAPPPPDPRGEANFIEDGVRIREEWQEGVLTRRTFEAIDDDPKSEVISVSFVPSPTEGLEEAFISHPSCGYEARVVTWIDRALP